MNRGTPWPRPPALLAQLPVVLPALLFTGLLTGCGAADESPPPLLVLAASSLVEAFEELIPAYEDETGDRVHTALGSSGMLAAQIRNGAPADVFLSANARFLDDLIQSGRIDPGSRTEYAGGVLALVASVGTPLPARPEELAAARYRIVVIANPDHAPYGVAADDALRSLGVRQAIDERLVMAESVSHALQLVRTGNADLGLVALSVVSGGDGSDSGPHYLRIDPELHAPLVQVAGAVAERPHPERTARFLRFLESERGRAILERHGFVTPQPGGDR